MLARFSCWLDFHDNTDLVVKRKRHIGWPGLGMPSHGARSLLILLATMLTTMLTTTGYTITFVLKQLQGVAALGEEVGAVSKASGSKG